MTQSTQSLSLADQLNRLLSMESASLLLHLLEAKPYLTRKTYPAWATLKKICHATRDQADQLDGLIDHLEFSRTTFPIRPSLACYHFQSIESLIPVLIKERQSIIDAYRQAVDAAQEQAPDIAPQLDALRSAAEAQLADLRQLHQTLGS